tara:strand:- start:180 stop:749 length:570 start_codon:yes stop_codon:yes gene_type:complete
MRPEVGPKTWDDAAALAAHRIDSKKESGIHHPHADDREELLNDMRCGFDEFLYYAYGLEIKEEDTLVISEFLTAFAILVLDLIPHYDDAEYHMYVKKAEEVLPLLLKKQMDYGYENISRFGLDGVYVRMHDKIARIENITDLGDPQAQCEPLIDSLLDLIGYCIIGIMEVLGMWRLPLKAHLQAHPTSS